MEKNSKVISYIFLTFSSLVFVYVFYKSEFVHNGEQSVYYFKYYIFSLVLVMLSIISFYLKKEIKFKISIILISSIIGLFISEVILIYLKKYEDNILNNYILKKNPDYDFRTTYEAYLDFKKENQNYVIPLLPKHFIFEYKTAIFPLSGIPNKPVMSCNENGYYAAYENDRYGFNNPDDNWDNEVIDFILLGDSSTHGDCVNEANTIGGNLRSYENVNGLLNLAQAGNDPLMEYATLKEYLPKKKINNVVMLYHEWNDIEGLNDSLAHPILKKYFNDDNYLQNLLKMDKKKLLEIKLKNMNARIKRAEENQKEIDWQKDNKKLHERRKLFTLIRNTIVMTKLRTVLFEGKRFEKVIDPKLEEYEKILLRTKKFLESKNINFYLVYVTDSRRYLENNNHDNFRLYGKIKDIVKKLDINFIDLNIELYQKLEDPFELFAFGKHGGHNNEKGYEEIAKVIYNKIKN